MLYERWRQVARDFRDEIALHDLPAARRWTFAELDHAASTLADTGPVFFPRGQGAEFILEVLRAWKHGRITCPLESILPTPEISTLPFSVAHLKTTSATGGRAKLIAFTAAQLSADADNIVATMRLRRDWPNLGVISLAHSYGFSNLVTPLLLHGIPLILTDASLPETVRAAGASFPSITLPAVPVLWRTWLESAAIPASVRLAISAGVPLPVSLEQEIFQKRGVKVHNFYGASECGGIAYDATDTPRDDNTCVGTPLANVSLSVQDSGCLEVRGAAVGETYWPEPSDSLGHGVYLTSDLAEISAGQIFLRGRANDVINVAGRKVSPESIEHLLRSHPAVGDCLVFGAPSEDAHRGESIVVCVVRSAATGVEELRQHLLALAPSWQVPREFWFVDSLTANQRGKLSRAEWRSRFLARAGRSRS